MLRPPSLPLLALVLAVGACASEGHSHGELDGELESSDGADVPEPTWRSLIDHAQWQPSSAAADPRAEHRPDAVECEAGWYRETGGLEVDTSRCNYLSLTQMLPVELAQGDPVRLGMWWQTLASIDPAEGHIAVLVDGQLLWEEHVPIPSAADVRSLEFPSPVNAAAGAPITLHLHNHGYNTWHFHDLGAFVPSCTSSCDDTP
ncbi:MAG: hypothetical protein AB1Z98_08760 [Nannocystaceae bacterium]